MTVRHAAWALVLLLILSGCARKPLTVRSQSLAQARAGFITKPKGERSGEPVPPPPPRTVRYVTYPSPAGQRAAYLSPEPGDGKRHAAIVWITGGDCNSLGDVWTPEPGNDQTAGIFRSVGIVTMYPSLRGGNQNPGVKEGSTARWTTSSRPRRSCGRCPPSTHSASTWEGTAPGARWRC